MLNKRDWVKQQRRRLRRRGYRLLEKFQLKRVEDDTGGRRQSVVPLAGFAFRRRFLEVICESLLGKPFRRPRGDQKQAQVKRNHRTFTMVKRQYPEQWPKHDMIRVKERGRKVKYCLDEWEKKANSRGERLARRKMEKEELLRQRQVIGMTHVSRLAAAAERRVRKLRYTEGRMGVFRLVRCYHCCREKQDHIWPPGDCNTAHLESWQGVVQAVSPGQRRVWLLKTWNNDVSGEPKGDTGSRDARLEAKYASGSHNRKTGSRQGNASNWRRFSEKGE